MKATIDSVGRVVLPKQFRDALGLKPGTSETTVDDDTVFNLIDARRK
jgi:AbrB family looped-hinge helix DNA binding protein